MNAWAFGSIVLVALFIVGGVLLDRMADRGHALRWEERFYQPQLSARRRVIDVQTRNTPRLGDRGVKAADLPAPTVPGEFRR
jgi:hypothetical protein